MCKDNRQIGGAEFLAHLKTLGWYNGQNVHTQHIPARAATYAKTRTQLAPPVQRALEKEGVQKLYEH